MVLSEDEHVFGVQESRFFRSWVVKEVLYHFEANSQQKDPSIRIVGKVAIALHRCYQWACLQVDELAETSGLDELKRHGRGREVLIESEEQS